MKKEKEFKELIAENFVKLFIAHNLNETFDFEFLKSRIVQRLSNKKGRKEIKTILRSYYSRPIDYKSERTLIENLLFLIKLYENED